jgi:hypothetical protein
VSAHITTDGGVTPVTIRFLTANPKLRVGILAKKQEELQAETEKNNALNEIE